MLESVHNELDKQWLTARSLCRMNRMKNVHTNHDSARSKNET